MESTGNKILLAIQVLPTTNATHPYYVIDKMIELIASKGYKYLVCPFETVVECTLDDALMLVKEVHQECFKYDTQSLLINMKIHSIRNAHATIDDKIAKYR